MNSKNIPKNKNVKTIIYFILRFLVIICMIIQFSKGNYENAILCILTLVLFMIPTIIDKKLNIKLPSTLEIIILLFIFSAEILGEINEYYLKFENWDTLLHTLNGFLMGAIGFAMIDILNSNNKIHISLSPIFVILVAFCFSMTIGVIWEFFEFGMDYLFLTDMQKDTIISNITSTLLNEENFNQPKTINFESVGINSKPWVGYIDIGLYDTMKDLFVNFIGALIFSITGLFYIKDKTHLLKRFLPTKKL